MRDFAHQTLKSHIIKGMRDFRIIIQFLIIRWKLRTELVKIAHTTVEKCAI